MCAGMSRKTWRASIGDAPARAVASVVGRAVQALRSFVGARVPGGQGPRPQRAVAGPLPAMSRFARGITIVWVVLRYGLDELVLSTFRQPWLRAVTRVITFGRKLDAPRGQRLREAWRAWVRSS